MEILRDAGVADEIYARVSYFTSQLDAYAALDAAGHTAIDRANAEALFAKET
jgi:hypothetical protein